MMYAIDFKKKAAKAVKVLKKSNPAVYAKLVTILLELKHHPRTGTGHPEPLKGGDSITYSRHITASDRIIYDIYDDTVHVLVTEVGGHYNDK